MRVFESVLKALTKMNVPISKSVPVTDIQAVTRSMIMRVFTCPVVRPMMDDALLGNKDGQKFAS
jgi:hypothetical protein